MSSPTYIIGNTHQFLLTAKKLAYDAAAFAVLDAVWDLTTATVTLIFVKPDGTLVTKTASITNGPKGLAQYTTTTTDLDTVGDWQRYWRVIDGSVDLRSGPITFTVTAVV